MIIKYLSYFAVAIIIVSILYSLLFGKLFAFSPLTIGFTKHETQKVIFYVQRGAEFKGYDQIDSMLPSVEAFHKMKFTGKPKIYIFRDKNSYLRRSFSKARFYVYPNGSFFISPWAIKEAGEGKISLDIYVRHELSHVLLYQHMNLISAYKFPEWLMEGIAVYSTNQMGTSWYPGKKETYQYIRQGNFLHPMDFKTSREEKTKIDVKNKVTFYYSQFACIVDDLIETGGKEKFLEYLNKVLDGRDHDKTFSDVYKMEFNNYINMFRQKLLL